VLLHIIFISTTATADFRFAPGRSISLDDSGGARWFRCCNASFVAIVIIIIVIARQALRCCAGLGGCQC